MGHIKGTKLLVKALRQEGVDTVFAYPGGMVTDILDELYKQEEIRVILPRHEQALVHEADGYARSTGKVGVCIVTSGPGATNTITGIATAYADSVPLVVFTGQVASNLIGNDAFQEADIIGITRNICKFGYLLKDRADLARVIKEAFYIARTGNPGPVVIDLPKDLMTQIGEDFYPEEVNIRGYKPSTGAHRGQLKKAVSLLAEAKKPLFLIGGGLNISRAHKELKKVVDLTQVPVVTTIMGKGALEYDHPLYIGNLGMHGEYAANMAVSDCDVLFSVGTRFSDRVTSKISEFAPHAKIIHVDIDSSSISRNIVVDIPIVADAKDALSAMLKYAKPKDNSAWIEQIKSWKEEYPLSMTTKHDLSPKAVFDYINEHLQDSIVVTDVGQHQMWTTQFLKMNKHTRLLTSGGMGTMGFGFPAALGAKLGSPKKNVLCITGDGGFQMNMQEMATAVAEEIPVTVCLFNNGYLGMVKQLQKVGFNCHYANVCTRRRKHCVLRCSGPSGKCPPYVPDFVKFAQTYGMKGIRVSKTEEIADAFAAAKREKGGPTIIEFVIDSDIMVTPMVMGGRALTDMILEL